VTPSTGEDSDVERCLRHFGIRMDSCRNAANMVHLNHPRHFSPDDAARSEALMASKSGVYVCEKGLDQHMH